LISIDIQRVILNLRNISYAVALGQVMLYVDGMNGVMEHNATIQWLYSLIASKYRLVVKTALKLLLVFVEYVESNCQLLVKAIETVDSSQGSFFKKKLF
jgi:FH1/FH2 domain-containing protein 3